MNADQARAALESAVRRAVPGADVSTADPGASMREELDLDSLDFLAVVQAIHDITGVDIPEGDYGQVDSADDAVAYLCAHAAA